MLSNQREMFLVPRAVQPPRGAIWAGLAASWLLRTGSALWSALEEQGRRRAGRQLAGIATRCEPREPQLASQLRDAVQFLAKGRPQDERAVAAAEVREFAYRHLKSDPGFAADLFAAANRHEMVGSLRSPAAG